VKAPHKGGPKASKSGLKPPRRFTEQKSAILTSRKKPVNQKETKVKTADDGREAVTGGIGDGASVEKIRDILFGVQMRDYDKKFARLEERLLKETHDLKEDVKKSLGAFDTFVKHELEALAGRLKSEHEQRVAGAKDLAQELKELKQALQQKASHLEDQLATAQRELRQQMLDQHRKLSEEMRHKAEEAAAALKREAGELRSEKVDRAGLAALFAEVSLRLKDEFKIPGAERSKNG